jgi:hypothetical protein
MYFSWPEGHDWPTIFTESLDLISMAILIFKVQSIREWNFN